MVIYKIPDRFLSGICIYSYFMRRIFRTTGITAAVAVRPVQTQILPEANEPLFFQLFLILYSPDDQGCLPM